jgi:hypothetical protein
MQIALFAASLTLALLLADMAFHGMRSVVQTPLHATLQAAVTAAAVPKPRTLSDPLVPGRPPTLAPARPLDGGDWVTARPGFQYSHTAAERGGVEPCNIQQLDTSGFEDWAPVGQGRFTMPRGLALDESGRFDLVIHLHGDDPVRRELILSQQPFALYTLTLNPNQSYAPLFTGTHLYEAIVAGVEQAVSRRTGKEAHARHVVLSAWSAGFVGIEAALAQPASRDVEAVILIDGLHAPRGDNTAFKAQLQPFLDYAKRAAAGERFMFVSHSSIDPPDFASTTECAHYLIAALGGQPQAVQRSDALGLELKEYFNRGNFNVRGYAGNDKADHCAQLGVLRDVFAALGRAWQAANGK